jgi:hypothetical protein
MGIVSSITALLEKSAGSSAVDAARIRNGATIDPVAVANAINSLQRQINVLTNALKQSPTITEFEVTDTSGGLLAWIGSSIVAGVNYFGAWFRQLYIGGTSAATAKIVADANGDVTINGATFVFTANGTQTTLNGSTNPWSTKGTSLISTDIASGFYAMVDPFDFALLTPTNAPVAYIRNVPVGSDPNAVMLLQGYPTYSFSYAGNQAGVFDSATSGSASFSADGELALTDGALNVNLSADGTFNMPNAYFTAAGDASVNDLAMGGDFTGTHAQNVGTADSPTFLNVTTSGSNLNSLQSSFATFAANQATINTYVLGAIATLQADVTVLQLQATSTNTRLSTPHDHGAGSFDAGGTPVTGISGATSL